MLEIILEMSPGLTDQRKITWNLIEKWPKNHRKFLTFPTDNISRQRELKQCYHKNHRKFPTFPTDNISRQRELKQCYHKNREHLFIKTHWNKISDVKTDNKYSTLFFFNHWRRAILGFLCLSCKPNIMALEKGIIVNRTFSYSLSIQPNVYKRSLILYLVYCEYG